MADNETLIEFPCDFPIKVMGEAREDFAEIIVALIHIYRVLTAHPTVLVVL